MNNNIVGVIKGVGDNLKEGRLTSNGPDYRTALNGINFEVNCEVCAIAGIYKVGMKDSKEWLFSEIEPECPKCHKPLPLINIKGTWLLNCKVVIIGMVANPNGRLVKQETTIVTERDKPLLISPKESGEKYLRTKFIVFPLDS
eukprot:TRINITY_DN17136_c0_g1_i1.p1 TRINITY_DN17136_c0_g1~~TRINITY_DN17136_c0_g1_i1.p1  ORF type:complete len:143 (+),score=21.30 TRINITY_DN17136_c0_g1_i1:21-449(+)